MGKDKQVTQKDIDKLEKEIKDGVKKMVKDINDIHHRMEKEAKTAIEALTKRVTQLENDIKIMTDDMTKNMRRLADLERHTGV